MWRKTESTSLPSIGTIMSSPVACEQLPSHATRLVLLESETRGLKRLEWNRPSDKYLDFTPFFELTRRSILWCHIVIEW